MTKKEEATPHPFQIDRRTAEGIARLNLQQLPEGRQRQQLEIVLLVAVDVEIHVAARDEILAVQHHDLIIVVVEPTENVGEGAFLRIPQRPDPSGLHPGGRRKRRHVEKRGHVGAVVQCGAGGAAAVQDHQIGRLFRFGNLPAQGFDPFRIEQRLDFAVDAFAEEQNGVDYPVLRQRLRKHLLQFIRIFVCAADVDFSHFFSGGGLLDALDQAVELRADVAIQHDDAVLRSRFEKFLPDRAVARRYRIPQLRRQFRSVERLRIDVGVRFEHETHKTMAPSSFAILLFTLILYDNYNEKARGGLTKNKKNAIFKTERQLY